MRALRTFSVCLAATVAIAACSGETEPAEPTAEADPVAPETVAAEPVVATADAPETVDQAAQIASLTEALEADLAIILENAAPDASVRIDVTAQAAARIARNTQVMANLVDTPEFTEIAAAFEHESVGLAILLPRQYNALEIVLLIGDYLAAADTFVEDWRAATA